MGKAAVDPATEIYEVAQDEMKSKLSKMAGELESAKEDAFAMGVLKKIAYDQAHNEFLEHVVLSNIKQAKEYKKGGMTWKGFCDALGKPVRTVDAALKDISPLVEKFSESFSDLSGIKFSKIRYLGRSISENFSEITDHGIVVGDGEIIPIDPDYKDDIEAYIDSLKAAEKEAREEKEKDLKAKTRVIKTLHETIKTQENDLSRYVRSKPGDEPAAEKDQIKGIRELKGQFDLFSVGMGLGVNLYLYNAADRVKAEYFASLTYARQMIERLWEEAGSDLGFPSIPGSGENDWEPSEWKPDSAETEK